MSASVEVECLMKSTIFLMDGIRELNLAVENLQDLEREKRMMTNCRGQDVEIDYLIQNEVGEKIGIRKNTEGNMEFIVQDEKSLTAKATINKVVQAYARISILNEVKKKGYQKVKEEKLANGAIRIVVEKWR